MNNFFLNKNLAALEKVNPTLYREIKPLKGPTDYEVINSKSGLPTLIHLDKKGNKKQIHSNYDPKAEASRFLETLNVGESMNFIILGFGLGYQVIELIKNASNLDKFFIFEKDAELLALAMRKIDLSIVLEHPGVKLFVDTNLHALDSLLDSEKINFTLNKYCLIRIKSLVEKDFKYYGSLFESIEIYFKESQINLKTQSIHSKLYTQNIFSNCQEFFNSSGIISVKASLPDVPAIICSAGPSLDKNIQLLKSARNRFFLIAVATALKPLLHNQIQPDVVLSIDPDGLTINSFDLKNDDADFWLLFNSAVPNAIPKTFPKRRLAFDSEVFLAEWLKKFTEDKGSLGKISSVAHSAVKCAQFLGCSPIILVGQDLSFCKQRQHCLNTFYHEGHMDKVSRLSPLSNLDQQKFIKFGFNIIYKTDLFGERVATTLAMDSYNHLFSNNIEKSHIVINATEGGIPIQGTQEISLREALYSCNKLADGAKDHFEGTNFPDRRTFNALQDSLLLQINILKEISEKLKTLELSCLNPKPSNSKGKQLLITEMDKIYKRIMENTETALLLQAYDFAGFSKWYCLNSKILRKKELTQTNSLLDEEYERDIELFDVLVESVEYMRVNFEKLVRRSP